MPKPQPTPVVARPVSFLHALAREVHGDVVGPTSISFPRPSARRHDRSITLELDYDFPDGFQIDGAFTDSDECRSNVLAAMMRILFRPDAT